MTTLIYDGKKYEITIEFITPEIAKEYLKTIQEQRDIKPASLKRLIRIMQKNQWYNLNGDTIKFDKNGHLIDGQHRLKMVVITGESIITFVIRGINFENTIYSLDRGAPRRLNDLLKYKGYPNCSLMASLLRILYSWKYQKRSEIANFRTWLSTEFNDAEAISLLNEHPNLSDATTRGLVLFRTQKFNVFSPTLISFYGYILPKISLEFGFEFLNIMIGKEKSADTPIDFLLNKAANVYASKNPKDKLSQYEWMGMINKTWNLFIRGQRIVSLKSIVWRYNEKFPDLLNENEEFITYNDINFSK